MSNNSAANTLSLNEKVSANLLLENLLLVNLKQLSYDLANQLQEKNSERHSDCISQDQDEIHTIEKTFQPVFSQLREQESLFTAKELLSAIAVCLKKQSNEQRSPTNEQNLDVIYSSGSTKTLSTITRWFWPKIPQLVAVFQFIETNYNRQISISDVASEVGYSETYLCSLVKTKTHRTIHKWIVERRMLRARYDLLTTNKTVTKIAETVGYEDTGHFIRQFRKLHNISPKVWRSIRRTQNCIHPFNRCALIGMKIVK